MRDQIMRILIINYYYPPVVNAHAYRWEQIARHWVRQGHQVEVITGRVLGAPNDSQDAGVSVTRVGLTAVSIKLPSSINTSSGLVNRCRAFLLKLLRPIYRSLYWPDAMWHWIPSVVLEVLRRRFKQYDLIVSYYPCVGAHLAAAVLKKWTKNSKITWIADYGDPFSTSATMPPNNFKLYSRLNKFFERNLVRSANVCVFTNENTAAMYRGVICQSGNIKLIPHLVDVEKFYAGKYSECKSLVKFNDTPRVINLVYIGGFHRGIREPVQLFDLIRRLNKQASTEFRLTIYGPANGFDLSPKDCPYIDYMGEVEREKAVELIGGAGMLINVDNENCVMVPSKLIEYIGTGRPIINLGRGRVDYVALQRYVADGHALLVSPTSLLSDGVKLVEKFILNKYLDVAPFCDVLDALDGHALEIVADEYKDIYLEPDLF